LEDRTLARQFDGITQRLILSHLAAHRETPFEDIAEVAEKVLFVDLRRRRRGQPPA
jgi:hypothetical protein